nr:MAG: hypothetical protein [Bacteriophage sp.]
MLEDRIIVQDRGIDAGLAALMQNANKGSMDPAALLAMMNNNGMGGNGGWWWIWIILLFFCWGGNGYRNRVRTVDNYGIPVLRTNYVTTDTTSTSVTYGLCPRIWR